MRIELDVLDTKPEFNSHSEETSL